MIYTLKSDSLLELLEKTERPSFESKQRVSIVRNYLSSIKKGGDKTLLELASKFDGYIPSSFKVDLSQLEAPVTESFKRAYSRAKKNIETFHRPQMRDDTFLEIEPELFCGSVYRPFKRVGLYIPGGKSPLVSTLMMTAIPAKMAGVSEIVVTTPTKKEGPLSPEMAFVLKDLHINEVYSLGGIQAIGGLAYGTETIKKVEKIFGPGNAWVTEAKKQVSLQKACAIDFEAGPSEIVILADDSAHPEFIASDLLSQLEHGPDSQAILVTDSEKLAEKVEAALLHFSHRFGGQEILGKKGEKTFLIIIKEKKLQMDFLNEFAPEHLSLQTRSPRKDMEKINNAGCLFLGAYTPESLGDYASGTNHVLPTGGEARFRSGLGIQDFSKRINFQEASQKALSRIAPTIETLANVEGLKAHAFSVSLRVGGDGADTSL